MKKIINPLVTVIISNYNGSKYLHDCLSSLKNTIYKNLEIVLFDDASTDNSVNIIQKEIGKDKRFKIIINEKNLGLTVNKNRGAQLAKGGILIFLDNDTEVDPNWIEPIIRLLTGTNNISACQCLLILFDERKYIQMAGLEITKQTGWGIPIADGMKAKEYCEYRKCLALGAAMAVKKNVFDKIGGFDEKLVHYTDDLDFSWRLWIAGFEISTCPDSKVYHYEKPARDIRIAGGNYEAIYFHLAKNSIRSMLKNYELVNILQYLPITLSINLGRGVLFILTGKGWYSFAGSIKGVFWNLININSTLLKRKEVQRLRIRKDKDLMDRIFSKMSLKEVYRKFYAKK